MTKKELMEKLVRPIINTVKLEGLIVDIDKIYDGDLMKFDKDLYHYIAAQFAPIALSYIINTENLSETEKTIATKMTDALVMACDEYYSKENGDDKGGTT